MLNKVRNAVSKVVNGVNYIGMACCFVLVFIVAIDVILRKASGQKLGISGSNEISCFFLIVMTTLAIPTFQVKKGHVWVNMFVDMFPKKFRSVWLGVVHLIETVVSGAICYGAIMLAIDYIGNGRATDLLNWPYWPFAIVIAFAFFEMTVLLAVDTIQHFIDAAHGGEQRVAEAE